MKKEFYFTFGQNHLTKDGQAMKNCWVTVVAESYGEARKAFILKFAIPIMGKAERWAFQYEEGKDWKPFFFPAGEYKRIEV